MDMRSSARMASNKPWNSKETGRPARRPFLVVRRQAKPRSIGTTCREVAALCVSAWPVLRFLLTPLAVTAGAVSIWRLGADPGWTNGFFIAQGFLSHWQVWLAAAIGTQLLAFGLNRWVPAPARKQEA